MVTGMLFLQGQVGIISLVISGMESSLNLATLKKSFFFPSDFLCLSLRTKLLHKW